MFNFPGSDTHGQKFIYLPTFRTIFEHCILRRGQFDTEFTLRAARARLWLAEVPVPIEEVRKARNFMLGKIGRNMVDILLLRKMMREIPSRVAMRYHRWSREDVENVDDADELDYRDGRLHRRATIIQSPPRKITSGIRSVRILSRLEFRVSKDHDAFHGSARQIGAN